MEVQLLESNGMGTKDPASAFVSQLVSNVGEKVSDDLINTFAVIITEIITKLQASLDVKFNEIEAKISALESKNAVAAFEVDKREAKLNSALAEITQEVRTLGIRLAGLENVEKVDIDGKLKDVKSQILDVVHTKSQRLDALNSKIDSSKDDVVGAVDQKFLGIDQKINWVEKRFDLLDLDKRFEQAQKSIASQIVKDMQSNMDPVKNQIKSLIDRQIESEKMLDSTNIEFASVISDIKSQIANDKRLEELRKDLDPTKFMDKVIEAIKSVSVQVHTPKMVSAEKQIVRDREGDRSLISEIYRYSD